MSRGEIAPITTVLAPALRPGYGIDWKISIFSGSEDRVPSTEMYPFATCVSRHRFRLLSLIPSARTRHLLDFGGTGAYVLGLILRVAGGVARVRLRRHLQAWRCKVRALRRRRR